MTPKGGATNRLRTTALEHHPEVASLKDTIPDSLELSALALVPGLHIILVTTQGNKNLLVDQIYLTGLKRLALASKYPPPHTCLAPTSKVIPA